MKIFITLMSVFLISACMPFSSSQPAPAIYTLNGSSSLQQQVKKNILHVIAVQQPEVPAGFDTDKIALYLYNKRRLDYYKNAVWPAPLGTVVGDIILQSARTLPHTIAVTGDAGTLASAELYVKVNDLEPVYVADATTPPRLRVSLSFRLVAPSGKKILLEATYSATTPATANTQTAIVSGLAALLQRVNRRAFTEIYHAL